MAIDAKTVPVYGTFEEYVTNPLQLLVKCREQGEVIKLISRDNDFPYLLSNPEHIREVLIEKKDRFIKSKNLQVLKVVVGEGILTSEGERHRQDRQVMQPYFNMKHISSYAPTMVQMGEKMTSGWKDGETRNITTEMMDVTLDIITETMFGTLVKGDDGDDDLRNVVDSSHKLVTDKIRMEGHEPKRHRKSATGS